MSRIQADQVALSSNEPCCCELDAKGIGKRAPKEGYFSSAARSRVCSAAGNFRPMFSLSEDRRERIGMVATAIVLLSAFILYVVYAWPK